MRGVGPVCGVGYLNQLRSLFRAGVVKIKKSAEPSSQILERLTRLEESLAKGFRQVEESLAGGRDVFHVFSQGLKCYREELLRGSEHTIILERIRADRELRFPHRKVLDCLLGQYDFSERAFKEMHFSKLVKEARLGKNMAKSYISFLEERGYLQTRDDGYRKFIRIRSCQCSGLSV
jgi:hypothetical protein